MPLPASGTISLNDIATEFGGTAPHSVSEYYGAGGAPASGTISLASFYGRSAAFNFTQTISADTTNYNLRNAAVAAGWNGTTPLIASVTINSGVYVSANSTGTWAFDTGSIPAGSTLTLVNNGFIVGMGGAGSAGGDPALGAAGGSPGGPALRAQAAISVTNNGTIAGGGGGGGGGNIMWAFAYKGSTGYNAPGGGGGGGRSGRTNSAPGPGTTASGSVTRHAAAGGAGTVSAAGGGGLGAIAADSSTGVTGYGGTGGAGGGWGATGGTGGTASNSSGSVTGAGCAGGAGGAAVNGNSFITWVANGTRLGSINAS